MGYARVSTADQNLDRQTDRLTAAGAQRIFTDTVTGSTRDRPGLDAALTYLCAGDTLTVVSMDRLARSLQDLHTLVDELTASGVRVRFLQEGQTYSDDSSPVNAIAMWRGFLADPWRAVQHQANNDGADHSLGRPSG